MTDKRDGIRWLSVEDLTVINARLIAMKTPEEISGVFSVDALHTAQQSPCQHRYYAQTEDIITLASVLFESLARNHAFHNANKRTAAVAASIFMLLNGYELTAPDNDLVEVAVAIVTHEIDREYLEDFLYHWHRPIDTSLEELGNDTLRRLLDRMVVS